MALRFIPETPIQEAVKEAKHPGFYQILLDGEAKYIGRTARTIRVRLREHTKKLRGRIKLERVTCKYAFVEDPSLVDVSENALINYFTEHGLADWNASGFGSKVTGYGRGRQAVSDWAAEYPPDLDWPIPIEFTEQSMDLHTLIRRINAQAPITFSIPRKHRKEFRSDHSDPIEISRNELPFREWVSLIEGALTEGWTVDRQALSWYVVPRP